jgi:hypothetical protein
VNIRDDVFEFVLGVFVAAMMIVVFFFATRSIKFQDLPNSIKIVIPADTALVSDTVTLKNKKSIDR